MTQCNRYSRATFPASRAPLMWPHREWRGGGGSLLIWPHRAGVAGDTPGVLRDLYGAWADRWLYPVFVLVRWGGMERRVELFAAIRFDWQRYRMPVRALARKYDVHRRTVPTRTCPPP